MFPSLLRRTGRCGCGCRRRTGWPPLSKSRRLVERARAGGRSRSSAGTRGHVDPLDPGVPLGLGHPPRPGAEVDGGPPGRARHLDGHVGLDARPPGPAPRCVPCRRPSPPVTSSSPRPPNRSSAPSPPWSTSLPRPPDSRCGRRHPRAVVAAAALQVVITGAALDGVVLGPAVERVDSAPPATRSLPPCRRRSRSPPRVDLVPAGPAEHPARPSPVKIRSAPPPPRRDESSRRACPPRRAPAAPHGDAEVDVGRHGDNVVAAAGTDHRSAAWSALRRRDSWRMCRRPSSSSNGTPTSR